MVSRAVCVPGELVVSQRAPSGSLCVSVKSSMCLVSCMRCTVSPPVSLGCPPCAGCRFSISSSSSSSCCPSRTVWVRSSSRSCGRVAVVLRTCWTFGVPRPTCPSFPCVHRFVRVPSSSCSNGAEAQAKHRRQNTKAQSPSPPPAAVNDGTAASVPPGPEFMYNLGRSPCGFGLDFR